MSDVYKQIICRLCLEEVLDGNCESIDEIKKEILEVLLINIDFDISDNNACKGCLQKLHDCFDFKSTCFYVDDYITPFVYTDIRVDMKKVFQKVITKENVNLENVKICRLCMALIEDTAFSYNTDLKDEVPVKDVIKSCLPEMDLNTVHDPLICEMCLSSAERLGDFMKTCQEVERSIKNYCQVVTGRGILGRISLDDLLEFKNPNSTPISIQNNFSDAENALKCPKNDATVRVEVSDFDQSEVCKSSAKNSSSKRKRKYRKSAKKKKQPTHFCPKCPYSSCKKDLLTYHMSRHTDNEEYKCTLCPFVTDAKLSMKAHLRSHRGSTMVYGCPECTYETNKKTNLDRHLLKHKDKSEVEMEKCPLCLFESKYKNAVLMHRKLKHSGNKDKINKEYNKCSLCPFVTDAKLSMKAHLSSHRGSTMVYGCPECTYETNKKTNLDRHLFKHKDKSEGEMEKCPLCSFESKYRGAVWTHQKLEHSGNIKIYNCKECSFASRYKTSLLYHQKIMHRTPEKIPMYNCANCKYKTKRKFSLVRHMLVHEDPNMSGRFKCGKEYNRCSLCPFVTDAKLSMKAHLRSHRGSTMVYGCPECTYETNKKTNLDRHLLKHKDKSEVEMEKCPLCSFESKYKNAVLMHRKLKHSGNKKMDNCKECSFTTRHKMSLLSHQKIVHRTPEKTPMYNCANCKYKTKSKFSLVRHMRVHEDPNISGRFKCGKEYNKCSLCPFVTDAKLSMKAHLSSHRGSTMVYGCPECTYETNKKTNLDRHLLKHKDKSEVEMEKCPLCSFESKYRGAVWTHQKLEHSGNIKIYNCKECSFASRYKTSLLYHQKIMHRTPEKIPMYNCANCKYKTKRKFSLVRHMRVHENPNMSGRFKCGKEYKCSLCPFVTDAKLSMKAHLRSHIGSTMVYGCPECTYETNKKTNLDRHLLKHKDKSEVEMEKCPLCSFESKYKNAVLMHQKLKHSGNKKMDNCKECSFTTRHKMSLLSHQKIVHRTPEKMSMYNCENCKFTTKKKFDLVRHMRVHADLKVPGRLKCGTCRFVGKTQFDLKSHMSHSSDKRPYRSTRLSTKTPGGPVVIQPKADDLHLIRKAIS